jgi:hypothetical protein
MTTGTRTSARTEAPAPAPDLRTVTIDVDAIGTLALGELAELSDLTGIPLDELRYRLRPRDQEAPDPAAIIRVAIALAVVLERRTDPTLTMADARRWDIRVVTVEPDPPRRARGTRARSSRG